MKRGLYLRMAWMGMRKNGRLYLPYLAAGVVMVMIWYILYYLGLSREVLGLWGGSAVTSMLGLGAWVIAFFSLIFLFYTNSFLIRRRKREFGLYNVLGMNKRHIARILFWETLTSWCIVYGAGMVLGVLLSKAAELGLVNILGGTPDYKLRIQSRLFPAGILVYGGIYFLIFLNALRQIHFSNPIQLLRSEAAGEKPPKGNWLLAVLGLLILAAAYVIAVNVQDPVDALTQFFIAVLMVIAATYLLFIAGSVTLCRILQKNPRYYYKAAHFVSVSSMRYRMKRSGAGLASICILSTMVLVMLSFAVSMYAGSVSSVEKRCPYDLMTEVSIPDTLFLSRTPEALEAQLLSPLRESEAGPLEGAQLTDSAETLYVYIAGSMQDGALRITNSRPPVGSRTVLNVFSLSDYNRLCGTQKTLDDGEVLVCGEPLYEADTIAGLGSRALRVREALHGSPRITGEELIDRKLTVVVPDLQVFVREALAAQDADYTWLWINWVRGVDLQETHDRQTELRDEVARAIRDEAAGLLEPTGESYTYNVTAKAAELDEYFGFSGGLLFLAGILSAVFIFAATLIMYYKQVSEGYEDQSRFRIMRRVGMTGREIRRSVNSQMLTVFLLPLAGAALHLAFAMPMLLQILRMSWLTDVRLTLTVTGISFLIFALAYALVYKWTAGAYARIVSEPD